MIHYLPRSRSKWDLFLSVLRRPTTQLALLLLCFALNLISIVLIASSPHKPLNTPLPAFPGAEGFGAATTGGRFGHIVVVTNLNDTKDTSSPAYQGSFRWAVDHTWPDDPTDPYNQRRIIIFKVGGTIRLVDTLIVSHPFTTIAGQTAPGDGIILRDEGIDISAHDVIMRGIRVRVGDVGSLTCCRDAVDIDTYYTNSEVYNVIVDHSSMSWAIDENTSTWTMPGGAAVHDVTFQWNIISEGLQNSKHVDEEAPTPTTTDPHSMGMILGQDNYNMSIHHNLFANNSGRNPDLSGIVNAEVVDNVIYGWKNSAFQLSPDKSTVNVINNYFKPNRDSGHYEIAIPDSLNPDSKIFIVGNVTDDPRTSQGVLSARLDNPGNFSISTSPVFQTNIVNAVPALKTYGLVLDSAGVIYPARDVVDDRIVEQVRKRTGSIIDSQNQVGGWPNIRGGAYPTDSDGDGIPDDWERAHGLDSADPTDASNSQKLAPSGYSWIEEYVNSLIALPADSTK